MRFAKNMCPSQGTMDIFVEPVLPRPQIVICGSSPVAVAVADLAKRTGFAVTVCAPAAEQPAFAEADRRIEGYALPVEEGGARFVVVSTQGRGDEAALACRARRRCRLRRLRRQPQKGRGAQGHARRARRCRRARWRSSRRPPASISARSRRTRSRSRSLPRSSRSGAAPIRAPQRNRHQAADSISVSICRKAPRVRGREYFAVFSTVAAKILF